MPEAGVASMEAPPPGAPPHPPLQPPTHTWRALLWKLILAALLLLAALFGVPATDRAFLFILSATIVLWGALFVGGALWPLLLAPTNLRFAWVALAVGAYAAFAIPSIATGDAARMLDALGPVVALILAAQIGRHDLAGALRDWAVIMGLALYGALGVVAVWAILPFGPTAFLVAVLLPPVVSELALLLLRRAPRIGDVGRQALAVLSATLLSTLIISFTQYNTRMPAGWALFFSLIIGLLIGGALLLSLVTRPMFGAVGSGPMRALVELTHGALLIALAVYIPLRLFT